MYVGLFLRRGYLGVRFSFYVRVYVLMCFYECVRFCVGVCELLCEIF